MRGSVVSPGVRIAIVGATGAVGRSMLSILESRQMSMNGIKLFASIKSAGTTLPFRGKTIKVEVLKPTSLRGIAYALFSAGATVSREFAPLAVSGGTVVVDNSSAWRMDPEVPLVVPEVNSQALKGHKGLIANPNCSTVQLVTVLKPLHEVAKIRRVVVSTYQAVSGRGQHGIAELKGQIEAYLAGQPITPQVFPHPIAFNAIPQVDDFAEGGYTKEEWKVMRETRKILEEPRLPITVTTVRVPVMNAHSESVNVEFEKKLTAEDARRLLAQAPGVVVVDDPARSAYPLATTASGTDAVYVGRVREDPTVSSGLNLWIVSDNLRKGAALNAIQIVEFLIASKS